MTIKGSKWSIEPCSMRFNFALSYTPRDALASNVESEGAANGNAKPPNKFFREFPLDGEHPLRSLVRNRAKRAE